jgi:hypothetical protein
MVVLCSAPWQASFKRPPQGFVDAFKLVRKTGAKGLIFAQHNSNTLKHVDVCNGFFPCVLVDYEVAHRIRSYANTAE